MTTLQFPLLPLGWMAVGATTLRLPTAFIRLLTVPLLRIPQGRLWNARNGRSLVTPRQMTPFLLIGWGGILGTGGSPTLGGGVLVLPIGVVPFPGVPMLGLTFLEFALPLPLPPLFSDIPLRMLGVGDPLRVVPLVPVGWFPWAFGFPLGPPGLIPLPVPPGWFWCPRVPLLLPTLLRDPL